MNESIGKEKAALVAAVEECRKRFSAATPGTVEMNEATRDLGKALRSLDDYSGEPTGC